MRPSTIRAIKTILRIDDTVTSEERIGICSILLGTNKNGVSADEDMPISMASAYLNIDRVTLWRMCVNGKIESDRRGKKFFIKAFEIQKLKKGNR